MVEKKESRIWITNLVGKSKILLDTEKLYLSWMNMFATGGLERYREVLSDKEPFKFESAQFRAVIIRLRKPRAVLKVFSNWDITCVGCDNEEDLETAINTVAEMMFNKNSAFIMDPREMYLELSNVICSADIGRSVGCGIDLLKRAFLEAEVTRSEFAGGTYEVNIGGPVLRIFPNGKITATGFKSIFAAKREIKKAITAINRELDQEIGSRGGSCKIERFDPTVVFIKAYSEKAKRSEKVTERAIQIIGDYCEKVSKESFGGYTETFAAAALYVASILCDERLTQREVCNIAVISEGALRSAKNKMLSVLTDINVVL